MFTNEHLALKPFHLAPGEAWSWNLGSLSFIFLKAGFGQCFAGPACQPLAPGDVLVVKGAPGGKLCGADGGEMVFSCFSARFEQLLPLFGNVEAGLWQGLMQTFGKARLYPAVSPVSARCHTLLANLPPLSAVDHRIQLLGIAAAILAVEFRKAREDHSGASRPEERLLQVIEELSASELIALSVEELAGRVHCSRRHLDRLFAEVFGMSVAALKMEVRLLRAASLLRNPDSKIIEVAEESGFCHLGLFNTAFKRRFGETPSRWRKQARAEELAPPARNRDGAAQNGASHCRLKAVGICPLSGGRGGGEAPPGEARLEMRTGPSGRPVTRYHGNGKNHEPPKVSVQPPNGSGRPLKLVVRFG